MAIVLIFALHKQDATYTTPHQHIHRGHDYEVLDKRLGPISVLGEYIGYLLRIDGDSCEILT